MGGKKPPTSLLVGIFRFFFSGISKISQLSFQDRLIFCSTDLSEAGAIYSRYLVPTWSFLPNPGGFEMLMIAKSENVNISYIIYRFVFFNIMMLYIDINIFIAA